MFKRWNDWKLQSKMVALISITGVTVIVLAIAIYSFMSIYMVREQIQARLFAEARVIVHDVNASVDDVGVSLERLNEIIADVKIGETGYAFVVGADTTYIVNPSAPEMVSQGQTLFDLADEAKDRSLRSIAEDIAAGESGFKRVVNPQTGSMDWMTYVPIESCGWWLIVTVPLQQLMTEVIELVLLAIGVSVGGLIAMAAMAFLIARSVVKPLDALVDAAQAVARGELGSHADVKTGGEIGTLADAFNQMIFQLRDMLRNEQEQLEYVESMVQEYSNYMARVAQGDLSARLIFYEDESADDPLITLGRHLNETVSSLQHMIRQMHEAATNLNAAVVEILAATQKQATGAHEQSSAVVQTSTTVDELKAIAEQSVSRIQEVANATQRTAKVSRAGQQSVLDTIASMRKIKVRVEGIAENILALSEQTQQIGEIIATVNDIAVQSNILALNASVEAARAGEYGKGFAVVAVEVRNLAEQSRQATAQVKAILSDIQKATNATVMATEEGTKGVDEGMQLASQAGEAIEQLAAVIEESTQTSMQVVAGGRQQAAGVEQVALAMQNINQATVQGLDSTRRAEKATRELDELARSLTGIVEQYQL